MMRRSQPQKWLCSGPGAGFLLLLAGCAWIPPGGERAEFQEPPPIGRTLPQISRQEAATPVRAWPDGQWWRRFGSSDLDRIMEIALVNNPGLKKAYARLGEADAVAHVEGARLLPWLDADAGAKQSRYAEHGVVASYNPDLAGAEMIFTWPSSILSCSGTKSISGANIAPRWKRRWATRRPRRPNFPKPNCC